MDYNGAKYHYIGSVTVVDSMAKSLGYPPTMYIKTKKVFCKTKGYSKYLEARRIEEIRREAKAMKARLDYEYKTYGEVDRIDFEYYVSYITKYRDIL